MKAIRMVFIFFVVLGLGISPAVGTNGMNLEGYGPVSMGMGGVSMAFDNGTAALMNNPATLGLMPSGAMRLDLALGRLGPDVSAMVNTPGGALRAKSLADAFYMPAFGFVMKKHRTTFGLGVFAQGGMGTEFGSTSWMSDPSQGANSALTSGLVNRSEVGVGRVLLPLAYDVSPKFRVGLTADFVWAGIDLQLAMSESQFLDLATTQQAGKVSGPIAQAFGQLYEPFGGTGIRQLHHAYFDFSNDNAFFGKARGTGFGGKLGFVWDAAENLTIGGSYHTQTAIGDLTTSDATMSMAVKIDPAILQGQMPSGQYMDLNIPVRGQIRINDFQWPMAFGLGASYRPLERLMVAFDVRHVMWSKVMKDFSMTFTADDIPDNGAFAGASLDAVLFQDWKDQTIFAVGAEYDVTSALSLRAGFNKAKNPVPDNCLNALFPAIVEDHLALGWGYAFGKSSIDFGMTRGFNKNCTNPGSGVTSGHKQLNWQIMFGRNF